MKLTEEYKRDPRVNAILSDRGIRQAQEQGLFWQQDPASLPNTATGPFRLKEFDNGASRQPVPLQPIQIQPASIDAFVDGVVTAEPFTIMGLMHPVVDKTKMPALHTSRLVLTNSLIGQGNYPLNEGNLSPQILFSYDLRSSMIRPGNVSRLKRHEMHDILTYVDALNLSPNDILFSKLPERVAQVFVHPGYDLRSSGRFPDAGFELMFNCLTQEALAIGYLKIERRSGKKPEFVNGNLILHASDDIKEVNILGEAYDFGNRDRFKSTLMKSYETKPAQVELAKVLVCVTDEIFTLSSQIGVHVWDDSKELNLVGERLSNVSPGLKYRYDYELACQPNSWIDPGYSGIMTRHVKVIGKKINPLDPIGIGHIFFFPNGVENPYGSQVLQSQYQEQKNFKIAK